MAISFIIPIVILIIILASFIRQYIIRKQHPPGPLGFPFVGSLPFEIMKFIFPKFLEEASPQVYFKEMRKKYGDVWSIDLGSRRMVVLASLDAMTEAFLDNAKLFSGRTIHESYKIIGENHGMTFLSTEFAFGNRQLVVKSLRNLGMGKQLLEEKIRNEVDDLIVAIEKNSSKPMTSPLVFVNAVSNVTRLLLFDERNKYNDPQMESFFHGLQYMMHSNEAHDIFELFGKILDKKYLRNIFPAVERFIKNHEACMKFISSRCQARIKIESEFSKPNCVFDYFWRYRYQDYPEIDPKEKLLDITHVMFDIAFGGYDTTNIVLGFGCLILGKYPDIQKELRTEIQNHVDDHKLITFEMRKDFHKLLSFIDELHRYCHLVPLLLRRSMETCMFRGYKIDPYDIVYGDLGNMMRDPELFDNPHDFNLYRFMDESRTKYVPNKSLIAFGIGKRACPGEGIAIIELFLFLSKIIQRFNISLPNETKINFQKILEGSAGIIHSPLDHSICFELIDPMV